MRPYAFTSRTNLQPGRGGPCYRRKRCRQWPASGPPVARRPRPPVTPPAAPSLVAVGVGSAGRAHCRCLRPMTWGLGARGSNGPGAGARLGDSVVKPCQPTCLRHPGGIHSRSALSACLLNKRLLRRLRLSNL
jgi:hypothetical protein